MNGTCDEVGNARLCNTYPESRLCGMHGAIYLGVWYTVSKGNTRPHLQTVLRIRKDHNSDLGPVLDPGIDFDKGSGSDYVVMVHCD